MKLLILTQAVDTKDTSLGFFHEWIREISTTAEEVTVVCLKKGIYNLPPNVRVFSLGKEEGLSRFQYVIRFYTYIFAERSRYDTVFVHMNQEYVLLGGLLWRWWGKQIGLWYNHTFGNWKTRLAMSLAHVIFYTSPYAFTAGRKASYQMPVGIDTNFFKPEIGGSHIEAPVLFLGRIDPVKKVELFIEAVQYMVAKDASIRAVLCGTPTPGSEAYGEKILKMSSGLVSNGALMLVNGVPHEKTKELYSSAELYVNLTQTGSFDKTILEAMACGMLVLVSNKSMEQWLPPDSILSENPSPSEVGDKAFSLLQLPQDEKEKRRNENRSYVTNAHSLTQLVREIMRKLSRHDI